MNEISLKIAHSTKQSSYENSQQNKILFSRTTVILNITCQKLSEILKYLLSLKRKLVLHYCNTKYLRRKQLFSPSLSIIFTDYKLIFLITFQFNI